MTEMSETADDVVIIDHGRIVTHGTLQDVTGGHASLEDAFFSLTGGSAQLGSTEAGR
jgi:ABC-2 type transport system ATP-binding protein